MAKINIGIFNVFPHPVQLHLLFSFNIFLFRYYYLVFTDYLPYLLCNHIYNADGIISNIFFTQMLGGLCQSLLVKYGMSEASSMGSAFHSFLTTASACLLTTALLIACYVLSSNSQQLIRQSIFVSSLQSSFRTLSFFIYKQHFEFIDIILCFYFVIFSSLCKLSAQSLSGSLWDKIL